MLYRASSLLAAVGASSVLGATPCSSSGPDTGEMAVLGPVESGVTELRAPHDLCEDCDLNVSGIKMT